MLETIVRTGKKCPAKSKKIRKFNKRNKRKDDRGRDEERGGRGNNIIQFKLLT